MTESKRLLTIGLTGPTGAGKSVVSSICRQWGIPSIDTDAVYHALLVPPSACLAELTDTFGTGICNPDGTLNRSALAAIVFSPGSSEKLEKLNRITHRFILSKVREICHEQAKSNVSAVLVDAPLLYESGFDRECDKVLAVLADPDTRLCRIMVRDGIPMSAAMARLRAQKPDSFYERADGVLYNNGSPDEMEAPLRDLLTGWGVRLK
jgi:dephospho-CoA kinase